MPLRIAVVIPLFNGASHIERTVLSVLRQTRRPNEVIVVDDGSTDRGGDKIVALFPDVRVVRQENHGVGTARNSGVERSSSEWVAFLDADDLWGSNHLQFAEYAIGLCPDTAFVGSVFSGSRVPCSAFDSNPEVAVREADNLLRRRRYKRLPRVTQCDYFAAATGIPSPVNSSSTLLRRDVFTEQGIWFPPDPFHEDLSTWCRVALRHRLTLIHRPTTLITQSSTSASEAYRVARSGTGRRDCAAYTRMSHFRVVEDALATDLLGEPRPRSLECYRDGVVTRHWPTVLLYAEQACGREAYRLLHHKGRPQAVLLLMVSLIPRPVAAAFAHLAQWAARRLGVPFPVSPFVASDESDSAPSG